MTDALDPMGGDGETPSNPQPPRRRCSTVHRKPHNRNRVYDFLFFRGEAGATDEEGARSLDMPSQCYVPRRGELARLDLVRRSGERRPTASGRSAAVWVATPFWEPARPSDEYDFDGGLL
jgi:hypothetical protein